jgi:transposase-like protein
MVSAALREVFNAEAEEDLLAFYRFPSAHWPKLRSTNNLERVNKEIARRSHVVGIFPNDASVIRLVREHTTESIPIARRALKGCNRTALDRAAPLCGTRDLRP